MATLLPVIVFVFVLIPSYYLLVGFLSVSSLVNEASVFFLGSKKSDRAPEKKAARWQANLSRVLGIALLMTGFLLLFTLTISHFPDIYAWGERVNHALMAWILFGYILNPKKRLVLHAVGIAVSAGTMTALVFWPEIWIVQDVTAIVTLAGVMLMLRNLRFSRLAICSAGLFLYDLTNVWITGFMLRLKCATDDATANMAVLIPDALSAGSKILLSIGTGDILIPGVWMMLAFRTAVEHKNPYVVVLTLLGIIAGWIAATATLILTSYPVPALVFLVPGAAAGYLTGHMLTRRNEKRAKSLT
jgi:presenilin-like A22 family membrane protease